jgi:hypothetical protein
MNENSIGKEVVDAAVRVHWQLGPGLAQFTSTVAERNYLSFHYRKESDPGKMEQVSCKVVNMHADNFCITEPS